MVIYIRDYAKTVGFIYVVNFNLNIKILGLLLCFISFVKLLHSITPL